MYSYVPSCYSRVPRGTRQVMPEVHKTIQNPTSVNLKTTVKGGGTYDLAKAFHPSAACFCSEKLSDQIAKLQEEHLQ